MKTTIGEIVSLAGLCVALYAANFDMPLLTTCGVAVMLGGWIAQVYNPQV